MSVHPFTYDSQVHTVSGRKYAIQVENLSPRLSEEERQARRRQVEEDLFRLFLPYAAPDHTEHT